MKKLLAILAAGCTVSLCSATAFAAGSNYVSGNLGVTFLSDADFTDSTGAAEGTLEYNTGWGIGGAIGHDYGQVRAEVEIAYKTNGVDKTKNAAGNYSNSADGDMTSLGLMVNGYYDFKNSSPVIPYLMGGIGFARVTLDNLSVDGEAQIDDSDNVFAYQVGAGIGYAASSNIMLDLGYRYFATADPDLSDVPAHGGENNTGEYHSHNIQFGIRFLF